jgi:hypothetical protein
VQDLVVSGPAVAGRPFHYQVALVNPLAHAYTFPATCPSYQETLRVRGEIVASQTYSLNCRAAPTVPPNTAVVFDMVLQIPGDVRAGRASIRWFLDPPYGFDGATTISIVPG